MIENLINILKHVANNFISVFYDWQKNVLAIKRDSSSNIALITDYNPRIHYQLRARKEEKRKREVSQASRLSAAKQLCVF